MWIMSTLGFFSVVCARKGDGRKGNPPDPKRLMVRARRRKHLEALQRKFPKLGEYDVRSTPTTDYRFRIFVPKKLWVEVMAALIADTDYDNFKAAVEARPDASASYERALHDVWSVMLRLQRGERG